MVVKKPPYTRWHELQIQQISTTHIIHQNIDCVKVG